MYAKKHLLDYTFGLSEIAKVSHRGLHTEDKTERT